MCSFYEIMLRAVLLVSTLAISAANSVMERTVEGSTCSFIYDSLIPAQNYNFTYKDGVALILAPIGSYVDLDCIPELNGNYSAWEEPPTCTWVINGNGYMYTGANIPPAAWGTQNTRNNPLGIWSKNGCELVTLVSPYHLGPDQILANYTCLTQSSYGRTSMSYLFYMYSPTAVSINPVMPTSTLVKKVGVGDTVNLTCSAYFGRTASILKFSWYKLGDADELLETHLLTNHTVTKCVSTSDDWWSLTLTIQYVTPVMVGTSYKCIVEKIDVVSSYAQAYSSYVLHSIDLTTLVADERRSYYIPPTSTLDENIVKLNTASNCTKDEPCTSSETVKLESLPVLIVSYALAVGLGVMFAVLLLVAILAIPCYCHRIYLLTYLKHQLGLSFDREKPDYLYHAVIFYSDSKSSEESFLQNSLLVKLENQWKYRVFVPQRDLLYGIEKAQGCVDVLQSSHKVIFILSEATMEEDWNQYALHTALREHRKIIIIIWDDLNPEKIIENVDKRYFPLESALKVAKVIDWEKDRYRWARLHLYLPLLNKPIKDSQPSVSSRFTVRKPAI